VGEGLQQESECVIRSFAQINGKPRPIGDATLAGPNGPAPDAFLFLFSCLPPPAIQG